MINVLFIIPTDKIGGAERVTSNYANLLASNDKYNVHILYVSPSGGVSFNHPGSVHITSIKARRFVFTFFKLYKLVKEKKIDIIFSSLIRSSFLFSIIKNIQSLKLIIRQPTSIKALGREKNGDFWLALCKYSFYKCDSLIVQSKGMSNEVRELCPSLVHKIYELENLIDTEYITKSAQDEFDLFDDNNYYDIVYIGRISREKGLDRLLKSLSIINMDSVRLWVCGGFVDSKFEAEIKDYVREYKLTNNVEFCGFQDNPYKFIFNADLLVIPSRREGFPNVMLESFVLKTPVVITNCAPSLSDYINKYKAGIIVDNKENPQLLAEAIKKVKEIEYEIEYIQDDVENKVFDLFK